MVTSMDKDGTKEGFDLELMQEINARVNIPIIASGGLALLKICIRESLLVMLMQFLRKYISLWYLYSS